MSSISDFVWAGLAGGGLSALLLSIAAVLGKSQLAHWLNKDIERIKANYQAEMAEKQAQYQMSLEAYRTTLIAQTEATKASQEVKKVMAVKMAELKFEAIKELRGVCNQIGMLLSYAEAARRINLHVDYRDMAANGGHLHAAMIKAQPFLSPNQCVVLMEFINNYSTKLNQISRDLSKGTDVDAEAILQLLVQSHQECEDIVLAHISEMLSMSQGHA